jgi:dGTPase
MNKSLLLMDFRKSAEEKERVILHSKAAFSKEHSRYFDGEEDYRLPYKRDVDRIVHSKAFTRYVDKTQVVYLVENDHITHRSLHVQLVSNFARGIAEILRLNQDLVEAVALGHDVGHPPFGHEGEGYLSTLTQEHGLGSFAHPWQSCRLLSEIEPLNLGLAVYDGFLCHDGGMQETKFVPRFGKTWQDHLEDKQNKLHNPEQNIWPGTLEGCLVKICDTISYLARDIEDAISLGIIKREALPKTILGTSNGEILSKAASDIIQNSYDQQYIALSDEVYDSLKIIRRFNFENIYTHPKLKVESKKIENAYRYLFDILLNEHEKNGEQSYLWKNFTHNKSERYKESTLPVQQLVDYIAGMTDSFFVRTLEKLLLPRPIEIL